MTFMRKLGVETNTPQRRDRKEIPMRLLYTLVMTTAVIMAASWAMAGDGCSGKKPAGVAGVSQSAVTVDPAKCGCGPACATKCGDKCACPTGKTVGAQGAKASAQCGSACATKPGARAAAGSKAAGKAMGARANSGAKQVSCTCASNTGKTTKVNCRDCQGPKDGKCPATGKSCNKQKNT